MVQAWKPKEKPEYRGFRCANCQKSLYKAWHHWYEGGLYKTPVHLCNKCEFNFKSFEAKIVKPKVSLNITKFYSIQDFQEKIKTELKEIVDNWSTKSKPVYKTFTCDSCGKNMHKAYHFWFRIKEVLSEAHFCKKCGDKLGLNKLK